MITDANGCSLRLLPQTLVSLRLPSAASLSWAPLHAAPTPPTEALLGESRAPKGPFRYPILGSWAPFSGCNTRVSQPFPSQETRVELDTV